MPDDAELLRRYADGKSEEAFAELVRRYLDLVYSAALRQLNGDAHRARDVAQVVFTTLARKAASLTSHPVLAGWLYTATQHAAAKAIRTETRRRAREQEAHAMNESLSHPEPEIDWDQVRPVLDDAMRALNDRDREAVLLRYFAHRPFAEIGATLNVSEDGARMRVDRAVAKLHALLAQRGVTSTAAALALVLTQQAVAAAPAGLAAQLTGSALAGGVAATGDLMYFMSTTKFISVAAAAAVILALGGAFYEARVAREAEAALATVQRENASQLLRLQSLTARVHATEQEAAQLQQSLNETRATIKAAEATRAGRATAANGMDPQAAASEAGAAFLAAHPDVKLALVERSRARVASRFYPFYAKLKLSPAKIDRFEELLIEREGLSGVTTPLSEPMNLKPGIGLSNQEVEDGLRELLGQEDYKEYQEAARMGAAQQFTTGLAAALYFTSTPLTAQQADQMGKLIVELRSGKGGPGTANDWDQLIQRAGGILTEPQVAVIGRLRAQEEFGMKMKTLGFGK